VFVTATGRTLDLAQALVSEQGILLTVSPGMAGPLVQRLRKYIFPADKVEVRLGHSRALVKSKASAAGVSQ
jgi:tRNA-modifying protein YgfZ